LADVSLIKHTIGVHYQHYFLSQRKMKKNSLVCVSKRSKVKYAYILEIRFVMVDVTTTGAFIIFAMRCNLEGYK
jgi:hypothetical protein